MVKSSLFICLGVLLLFSIKKSAGFNCYDCINCNDPFDSNGVSTTVCTGSCSKTKAEASGVQTVTRACMAIAQNEGCTEGSVGGSTGTICYCNTDKCNGVEKQTATVTLMVALATSAYKLFL